MMLLTGQRTLVGDKMTVLYTYPVLFCLLLSYSYRKFYKKLNIMHLLANTYMLFNVLSWLWNIYEGASVYFITSTEHSLT